MSTSSVPVSAAQIAGQVCLPHLCSLQNGDGGWGFAVGGGSRVEPTAWALLALSEFPASSAIQNAVVRGTEFIKRVQLADGSWPTSDGQMTGAWVTSIAIWALLAMSQAGSREVTERALSWLVADRPRSAGFWRRLVRTIAARKSVAEQDDSYYGWSWTPQTASWVEPTAQAVVVLQKSAHLAPAKATRRLELAELMLFDRMCPGGGWNCGNPMVYGVPGEPLIGPTVWALLALRDKFERPEIQQSLAWLEKNWNKGLTLGSLALSHIAFATFQYNTISITDALCRACEGDNAAWTVPAIAWVLLAISEKRAWLLPVEREKGR
ncbi:MAG: prenyltransferase/squalene oxidase repeat-containing protein [Candidatus Acidiferrales bacterium]